MPAPELETETESAPVPDPTIQPYFEEYIDAYANEDIVGYLIIDGTSVDYLVVQAKDNEFYLTRNINKVKDSAGWIFMDYENDIKKRNYNTVIYGHNMKADAMFHSIRYYRTYDYFLKHRFITFNTLYEEGVWEVFSFYKTDVNFDYIRVYYPNDDFFYYMAMAMKQKSMYDTGVEIQKGDRILTLSTCTNETDNSRFALHAKLIVNDVDQKSE